MKVDTIVLLNIICFFFNFTLYVFTNSTHPNEVAALKSMRRSLIDPLHHLDNWGRGDPCTSPWNGILCFDEIGKDGYLHVQEIQLLSMNLSGTLAPDVGKLSHLKILDFMWNRLNGSIPKEIGNLLSLELLLLNGNQLSGSLPDELGFLANLDRLQVDENNLSGPVPKSYANMSKVAHLHLNNNSFSGQLPPEFSQLPELVHFLLDNNNMSGKLPPEYSALTQLEILQLDNNQFIDGEIPESYQNLSRLVKLSLRNCSLRGPVPDLSQMPYLSYIDLSWNNFTGSIPTNKLSDNITTIYLSHNNLNGSIPKNFSILPALQMLSLENNSLNGSIPANIWHNKSFNATARLSIDLRYNSLSNVSGDLDHPRNVTLKLRGNPVCNSANIQNIQLFCDYDTSGYRTFDGPTAQVVCSTACPIEEHFEPVPELEDCICAAPIRIGYRLKSPSFTYFPPYIYAFKSYITRTFNMDLYQFFIDSYAWEEGPRLRMYIKLFPDINKTKAFKESEILYIRHVYSTWNFSGSDLFGPYELLNFTLLGPYHYVNLGTGSAKGGISTSVLAGILVGAIVFAVIASVLATYLIMRRKNKSQLFPRNNVSYKISIEIDGVKDYTFRELSQATNNFNNSAQVGTGGYGKVYRGILASGTTVAVKRAEEGSLQGKHEFLTEIRFLSRLHHRNLVTLVGYCVEDGEQMLVYEFMSNGTLREWISGKCERTFNFVMRLQIALDAAKGILYLHTEANPPIFHRDIKASNILLDANLTAKVADFGISHLAPVMDDKGSIPHHISTIVKGTPGYLDPEYLLTHQLTDKSDVYSLGVVFLELVTGVPPIFLGKSLVHEVNTAQKSGSLLGIIDKRMGACPWEYVERFIVLALRCCEDKPEMRPSMLDVVRELENILQLLTESMAISESSTSQHFRNSSSTMISLSNFKSARMSYDVSGSDLTSSVMPTISPR